MKNIFIYSLLLCITLVSCTPDVGQITLKGDLTVTVTLNGNPAENAKVYTNPYTKEGFTDEFGTVLLSGVDEASYEVFASIVNVGSGKTTALVRGNQLSKVSVNVVNGLHIGIAPSIIVTSPKADDGFADGEEIEFSALVTDGKSSSENIEVSWESDIDGVIHTGKPTSVGISTFKANLSGGVHMVTLKAVNEAGFSSTGIVIVNTLSPQKIVLESLVKNNAAVELKWNAYTESDFFRFEVYRSYDECAEDNKKLIATISDKNATSFIDKHPPIEENVCYYLRVTNKDNYQRDSNTESTEFPSGPVFDFSISDMVKHPTKSYVYLISNEEEKIIQYDYANYTVVKEISLSGTIGYSFIAMNKGELEIYAPSSDGWVYIYDAETLAEVGGINTGLENYSVVTNGNDLVMVAVKSPSSNTEPVRVYSRSTGLKLGGGGTVIANRLAIIPGTNEVISVRTNPAKMEYFRFNSVGVVEAFIKDKFKGDFPIDASIFEVSDDASYFISSKDGATYKTGGQMEYDGQLQHGLNEFSSFAFSTNGKTIYAGTSNHKSIQVGRYPELTRQEEFETRGLPHKIVLVGNKIIALSKSNILSERSGVEVISF